MEQVTLQPPVTIKSRLQDYAQLTKLRLALLVVFSAAMGFMTAPGPIDFYKLMMLVIGGFLVTGSSNGLNQIFERDLDKIMDRTSSRPLPEKRLSVGEAA